MLGDPMTRSHPALPLLALALASGCLAPPPRIVVETPYGKHFLTVGDFRGDRNQPFLMQCIGDKARHDKNHHGPYFQKGTPKSASTGISKVLCRKCPLYNILVGTPVPYPDYW